MSHTKPIKMKTGWWSAWHHLVLAQKNDRVVVILGTVWAQKGKSAKNEKNKTLMGL
jgi:hypothetical protein